MAIAAQAARWLEGTAVEAKGGHAWPANPQDPASVGDSLYSGTPGVVLFLLQYHQATGDPAALRCARGGADHLLAVLEDAPETGLYEGVAGIGFTLREAYKAAHDQRYQAGAQKVVDILARRAKPAGNGVAWNPATDVVSGAAGTGLFLLYADREWHARGARDLAVRTGRRLIELGRPDHGGVKWPMDPGFPRLMPNFAHGTAGVAYFLATLHQATGDRRFLDAAVAGATYLEAVAKTEGDVCLVFHDEPDNPDLYYLGWCHGPPGTARLFFRLYEITRQARWLDLVKRSANGVLASGIPDRHTPGFWNNVGQCCGSAGIGEFFLSLFEVTGDRRYQAFARRLTAQICSRAVTDAAGARWPQAEHRTRPDLVIAQTGLMQGAAGIASWLVRSETSGTAAPRRLRLPDAPF